MSVLHKLKRFHANQNGLALTLVLAFMALTVPVVAGSLAYSSQLSLDSRIKTGITKSTYSAIGGEAHGRYRLLSEAGFADSLVVSTPFTYSVGVNDGADVTITRITDPNGNPPQTISSFFKNLLVSKTASPDTGVLPDEEVTYIITIQNTDPEPAELRGILDGLPSEFTYVAYSAIGVTTEEPTIEIKSIDGATAGQLLTWDLATPVIIPPSSSVTLEFRAITGSAIPEGNYCNQAWVEPGGKQKTGTGATAKVTVGTPADPNCPGEVATISKTVTRADGGAPVTDPFEQAIFAYTISVTNSGTGDFKVNKIWDVLPTGFTYVIGTTAGDFTTSDASSCGGSCVGINWTFGATTVLPGQTLTLSFNAQAPVELTESITWNEAWAFLPAGNISQIYSWPTAPIFVMEVFEIQATDPRNTRTVESELWVAEDFTLLALWNVRS
ncbi:MAG: DUF11 domain-containing protein [Chloroflexi bacterium]|nr:DUF11 domain-containing protein [Chloroflexota bacterium]